jgi:hypothetical protein
MQNGLTPDRYAAIDRKLAEIEAYLVALAEEIRQATAPVDRHNHTWLQADSAVSYAHSLRAALHREDQNRR